MIVRLTGGLGNQMFGYAFGRTLSLRRNESVQFHWGRATRDYELDKYNTQIDLVRTPIHSPAYDEPGFAFDSRAEKAATGTYFRGYWQSARYFKNFEVIVRQELTLKEPVRAEIKTVAEQLRSANSVFIHVRRGDYLNPGTKEHHAVPLADYYDRAVSYITRFVESPQFFVFSDDPSWCQQTMPYPVMAGFSQHEDLYLMQACRHGIGANSSFSWWANWLADSSERIKIAPKQWFMKPDLDTRDLIPEGWITL